MPFWKWFLCLLGGLIVFFLLYGFATLGVNAIPVDWAQLPAAVLAGLLGLFIYAIWTNMTEHRPISELSLNRMFKDLGNGLLIGVAYFGVVVGVMALMDGYSITGAHFNWFPQLSSFLFFFLVAVFEEILFRGVLFRLIDDRWNTGAALIVSSLAFGAMHLFNTGATLWSAVAIAIEAGLVLGAAYKCSGTLWLPIGIHWAWNYVQGNVLGFAVSGSPVEDKIFSSIISGPDWLTGGIFGAEASVPAVGVGLVLAIILLANCKRDRR
jgi:hypothetical protein